MTVGLGGGGYPSSPCAQNTPAATKDGHLPRNVHFHPPVLGECLERRFLFVRWSFRHDKKKGHKFWVWKIRFLQKLDGFATVASWVSSIYWMLGGIGQSQLLGKQGAVDFDQLQTPKTSNPLDTMVCRWWKKRKQKRVPPQKNTCGKKSRKKKDGQLAFLWRKQVVSNSNLPSKSTRHVELNYLPWKQRRKKPLKLEIFPTK